MAGHSLRVIVSTVLLALVVLDFPAYAQDIEGSGDCTSDEDCFCNIGFEYSAAAAGCVDIDECLNTTLCSHNCTNTYGSYYCNCTTGYELQSDQSSCLDINECSDQNGGCSQTCTNSEGSYVCECTVGYSLDETDGATCNNIDECALDTDGCDQACTDNDGSFTCSCNMAGYKLGTDGSSCVVTCGAGLDGCQQNCTDVPNGVVCSCWSGYTINSDQKTCTDINECQEGLDGCNHNCTNLQGSFMCLCDSGYDLDNTDFKTCNDINECDTDNGGCSQTCTNIPGSFQCSCSAGSSLASDLRTCDAIDECADGLDDCQLDQNQQCINIPESFRCDCATGFVESAATGVCSNIDECLTSPCGTNGICDDTIGSFACRCPTGYRLSASGTRCFNIDECEGAHGCGGRCVDTLGSYFCTCDGPYDLAADGRTCLARETRIIIVIVLPFRLRDIFSTAVADPSSADFFSVQTALFNYIRPRFFRRNIFINVLILNFLYFGSLSFDATVQYNESQPIEVVSKTPHVLQDEIETDGLMLENITSNGTQIMEPIQLNETISTSAIYVDPVTSVETEVTVINECSLLTVIQNCGSGFSCTGVNDNVPECEDTDECANATLNNCTDQCNNTFGSFSCYCSSDTDSLLSDGITCDFDECKDGSDTCNPTTEVCRNTAGSFECDCVSGYVKNNANTCVDVDECLTATSCDATTQDCVNTQGSFSCVCKTAYTDNAGTCEDINECLTNNGGCDYSCENTAGSFSCRCPALFTDTTVGAVCTQYAQVEIALVLNDLGITAVNDYIKDEAEKWLTAATVIPTYVTSRAGILVIASASTSVTTGRKKRQATSDSITATIRLAFIESVTLPIIKNVIMLLDNQLSVYINSATDTSNITQVAYLLFRNNNGEEKNVTLGSNLLQDDCSVYTDLAASCLSGETDCLAENLRVEACASQELEGDEVIIFAVVGSVVGFLFLIFVVVAIYYCSYRNEFSVITSSTGGSTTKRSSTALGRNRRAMPYYVGGGAPTRAPREPRRRRYLDDDRARSAITASNTSPNTIQSLYSASSGRVWRRLYTP